MVSEKMAHEFHYVKPSFFPYGGAEVVDNVRVGLAGILGNRLPQEIHRRELKGEFKDLKSLTTNL